MLSLLVQECGLKLLRILYFFDSFSVTPCTGVWIETFSESRMGSVNLVTPCTGVWIETSDGVLSIYQSRVTPCTGVWIETFEK